MTCSIKDLLHIKQHRYDSVFHQHIRFLAAVKIGGIWLESLDAIGWRWIDREWRKNASRDKWFSESAKYWKKKICSLSVLRPKTKQRKRKNERKREIEEEREREKEILRSAGTSDHSAMITQLFNWNHPRPGTHNVLRISDRGYLAFAEHFNTIAIRS